MSASASRANVVGAGVAVVGAGGVVGQRCVAADPGRAHVIRAGVRVCGAGRRVVRPRARAGCQVAGVVGARVGVIASGIARAFYGCHVNIVEVDDARIALGPADLQLELHVRVVRPGHRELELEQLHLLLQVQGEAAGRVVARRVHVVVAGRLGQRDDDRPVDARADDHADLVFHALLERQRLLPRLHVVDVRAAPSDVDHQALVDHRLGAGAAEENLIGPVVQVFGEVAVLNDIQRVVTAGASYAILRAAADSAGTLVVARARAEVVADVDVVRALADAGRARVGAGAIVAVVAGCSVVRVRALAVGTRVVRAVVGVGALRVRGTARRSSGPRAATAAGGVGSCTAAAAAHVGASGPERAARCEGASVACRVLTTTRGGASTTGLACRVLGAGRILGAGRTVRAAGIRSAVVSVVATGEDLRHE